MILEQFCNWWSGREEIDEEPIGEAPISATEVKDYLQELEGSEIDIDLTHKTPYRPFRRSASPEVASRFVEKKFIDSNDHFYTEADQTVYRYDDGHKEYEVELRKGLRTSEALDESVKARPSQRLWLTFEPPEE